MLECVCVYVCVLVVQLCPTLCDPMDWSLPGSSVHGILWQEYWNGLSFPSPGDLPDPGIKPWSPTLQFFFFNHLSHQGSTLNVGNQFQI